MAEIDWDAEQSREALSAEGCVMWGCVAFAGALALIGLAFAAGLVKLLYVLIERL